ncbi:MAG: mechanosensitive ion channel protein [Robiginitomaculum sp.]|nr:MAG: mechanosensitive ion channel protein [Robiginitomaculum sp.]
MAQQQLKDKPVAETQPEAAQDLTPTQPAPENAGTEGSTPVTVPEELPDKIDITPIAEADGSSFSNVLEGGKEIAAQIGQQIFDWLTSPAFLAMVATVFLGYYLARLTTKTLIKRVGFFRKEPKQGKALRLKKIAWQLRDLIFPAVLITLYAIASPTLQTIPVLGQNWLVKIAQGLAVVFLLYTIIKRFIKHPLVQKIVIWIAIPTAILKVFGWYDEFQIFMQEEAKLELGNISIPAWTVANILIFGSILFWIGRISNTKGKEVIQKQESIDAGTREVFSKIFEMILFGILFVLLMNIAGINLGALVVLGGAIGLGLGFGLQQIAANFISGMILLLDRTLKVGDYVLLPDGREGFVAALNMRSATIETTDGKDIMVPNVKFIEDAYENWTHSDPRQRYEVYFSVAYNTNIDMLEDILIPAVSKHPSVLQEPEKPDLELREFGDFGIKFAIEFWCEGIDDGENKFTSDLNFIVWRTLKKHGIEMPLPQREVRILKD